jgi:CRISPR-associated protein Cas2
MNLSALNQYRVMWIMVFFDLPTETKEDRRRHSQFRKDLLKDGFTMGQLSVYWRHCASKENMEVHIERVKNFLQPNGKVCILHLTDKQFSAMHIFYGKKTEIAPVGPVQLEMF